VQSKKFYELGGLLHGGQHTIIMIEFSRPCQM
jgi:hypothetical protein